MSDFTQLRCSITFDLPNDPVYCNCVPPHLFSYAALTCWEEIHHTCPVSRQPIVSFEDVPHDIFVYCQSNGVEFVTPSLDTESVHSDTTSHSSDVDFYQSDLADELLATQVVPRIGVLPVGFIHLDMPYYNVHSSHRAMLHSLVVAPNSVFVFRYALAGVRIQVVRISRVPVAHRSLRRFVRDLAFAGFFVYDAYRESGRDIIVVVRFGALGTDASLHGVVVPWES
jgi:hypothetical protein